MTYWITIINRYFFIKGSDNANMQGNLCQKKLGLLYD